MNVHDLADCLRAQSGGHTPRWTTRANSLRSNLGQEEGVAFAELVMTRGKTVNLRKHRLCLFDRATHSGVKLALKINAIADLIQRVVDDAQFVFCEFHEHAPILYHLVNC
jgi:hypothetical protein